MPAWWPPRRRAWARMPGSRSEGVSRGSSARCGMGSFFKDRGCARPTRCPHPYTIRFRNGLGKQVEEGGFDTQDDAIERLTQIYAEKKRTAPSVAEARRESGQKAVAECAKQGLSGSAGYRILHGRARQQHYQRPYRSAPGFTEADVRHADRGGALPGSWRPTASTGAIRSTSCAPSRRFCGTPTARERWRIARSGECRSGVRSPEGFISDLAYLKQALAVAGDDLALEIVMMAGCGLRNGPHSGAADTGRGSGDHHPRPTARSLQGPAARTPSRTLS